MIRALGRYLVFPNRFYYHKRERLFGSGNFLTMTIMEDGKGQNSTITISAPKKGAI